MCRMTSAKVEAFTPTPGNRPGLKAHDPNAGWGGGSRISAVGFVFTSG